MRWLAPILLLSACGGLDTEDKLGCGEPADCNEGFACVAFECIEGATDQSDTDGDGLLDTEEAAGWEVVVDEQGFGLVVDAEFLVRRNVTSDPTRGDTDGDGLPDGEEFTERSDPRRADTDGDGLTDSEEKRRWRSNLLSVDSDGDSRDADRTQLPLAALFDGAEVAALTSPTLADTDGDGKTDFEERDSPTRDPRVAEIPRALITLADGNTLTVQMNITYADAATEEVTYGEEFTTTESTRTARTDTESTAVTIAASSGGEGFFDDLEFSKEGAIKFFGGKALEFGRSAACQARTSDQVRFDQDDPSLLDEAVGAVEGLVGDIFNATGLSDGEICEAPTPETTNTSSVSLTQESAREATQSYSEYRRESRTRTETASTGTVSLSITVNNVGLSTFELVNPTLTMMQWESSPSAASDFGAGAFRTLTTLSAIDGGSLDSSGNRTFVIGPDDPPAPIQLENRSVNADFIKGFLARPQAIFFSPASFELNDQDGANFDFLTEETFARTATLVIDDGVSAVQRFQVASNVDRTENGELLGARMGTLLTDILEIPYRTRSVERTNAAGETVMVDELEAIGDLANQRAADRGDPVAGVAGDAEGLWVVYVKREEQSAPELPFEELRLLPGDEVRLVYIRDIDGDGLMAREEAIYGTGDTDATTVDSDDDRLTDFQEVKVGWDVTIDYTDEAGAQKTSYRVTSVPTEPDADDDGLDDRQERMAGTDPNNPDTDDDGLSDGCEVEPLNTDNTEDNGTCLPTPFVAYVSDDDFGADLSVIELDGDGSMTEAAGSPFDVTCCSSDVAFTPDGLFAYVANDQGSDGAIVALDVDPATGLPSRNRFPQIDIDTGGLERYNSVAMHPNGEFVYMAVNQGESDGVYSFTVDRSDQPGKLTQIDFRNGDFSNPSEIEVTADGQAIVVLRPGRFGLYGIGTGADAGEPVSLTEPSVPGQPTVFAFALSPSGDTLYLASDSRVDALSLDTSNLTVTPIAGSPFTTTGTTELRALVADPQGRFLYSMDFDTVYLHRINPSTGTVAWVDIDDDPLSGVNTGYPVEGNAVDFKIDASGRYLYVLTSMRTLCFEIGFDGTLTEVSRLDVTGTRISVLSLVR